MKKLISQAEIIIRLENIYSMMDPKTKGTKFKSISGALDTIETGVIYNTFDLEATRRERDARKK